MTSSARKLPPAADLGNTVGNVWSEYEIEAKTSLVDRALRNLKHGDAFAVLDSFGDIGTVGDTAEGLFYRDTRFLSHFELRLEGQRPLLLSSVVHEDKAALSVELTNPDLTIHGEKLARDTLFLERTKFLWEGVSFERLSIKNYAPASRRVRLDFLFGADFQDMFEVRGTKRPHRGRQTAEVLSPDRVAYTYEGLDGIERRTVLQFSPVPIRLEPSRATISVELGPAERSSLFVTVSCEEDAAAAVTDFFPAYRNTRRARRASTANIATVKSSSELFDEVLCRATSDVYTLMTRTDLGPYPYAGIPWFNTIFGRDGIITAMLMLWMDASVARGVLRMLAATQATTFDPKSDAQPGKILHETRHGEMANLGEVPFQRYYGTVDATPLFVILAGMYLHRTGDRETILDIWPNIQAALRWMDDFGDLDGDGFVEYFRASESGLANQGWKDSHDAIFHADGTGAEGPIALCEVQAYVFGAKQAASRIAADLGLNEIASALSGQAESLRRRFEAVFWCDDIGTYALALDGAKRPCRVRSSNSGHALFAGIAAPERARKVAETLLGTDSFSGWGIRTLARGEPRYNPMSYHNGSVWPHDNALIAMGFARYGLKTEAAKVFDGLFEAATHQELRRLPELFCGFIRRPHRGPTPYPVACSPQAWAATATFGLLAACLGLELDHQQNEIRFRDPVMPDFLDEVTIENLQLAPSCLNIRLHRYGNDVTANVLSRQGSSRVLLLK
jgi:glycogen debranching enzyme